MPGSGILLPALSSHRVPLPHGACFSCTYITNAVSFSRSRTVTHWLQRRSDLLIIAAVPTLPTLRTVTHKTVTIKKKPFSCAENGRPQLKGKRNATQRNATQRNATQRNATQRNAYDGQDFLMRPPSYGIACLSALSLRHCHC